MHTLCSIPEECELVANGTIGGGGRVAVCGEFIVIIGVVEMAGGGAGVNDAGAVFIAPIGCAAGTTWGTGEGIKNWELGTSLSSVWNNKFDILIT